MKRLTMRRVLPWAVAAAVLLLAACSSPPLRYYSLAAPVAGSAPQAAAQTRSTAMFIEVAPVGVPERLARPQLVVQKGDGARVEVLEQDRWASSFNNELRDTLANGIAAQLGAVDIRFGGRRAGQPVYRIAVDLRQFNAVGGDRIDAAFGWTVTRSDDGRAASCQSVFLVPVGGSGVEALVAGMQQAVALATAAIAATVSDVQAGGAGCRS
jgi:uncharacterized lipoprotein YmbA